MRASDRENPDIQTAQVIKDRCIVEENPPDQGKDGNFKDIMDDLDLDELDALLINNK